MYMHSKWSVMVPRACSYTLGRGVKQLVPDTMRRSPPEATPSFPDVPRLSENVGICRKMSGSPLGGDLRILGLIRISSITDDLAIYFHSSEWHTKIRHEIPNTFPSLPCFPAVFVGELIGVKTPKSDMKYQIMLETSKSTLQHCHPQPYINI